MQNYFSLCYNINMKIDLSHYQNLKICVALSGGRDSMALLHFLLVNAEKFNLTICAVNCDHSIRGEASKSDSLFVRNYCLEHSVPLICYVNDPTKTDEMSARLWRYSCFADALKPQTLKSGEKWRGADVIATAHHMDDNAETVLFNLARGTSLVGLEGISDNIIDGTPFIRPLISVSRAEIENYIFENTIEYVDDLTNFSEQYTRNRIRRNILPALEKAVPNARYNIFKLSRLVGEYNAFFSELLSQKNLIAFNGGTAKLVRTDEKTLFNLAVRKIVAEHFKKQDFTKTHFDTLYKLQFLDIGKRFEFLNLTVYNERDGLVFCEKIDENAEQDFRKGEIIFGTRKISIFTATPPHMFQLTQNPRQKLLKFDLDKIPPSAKIRAKNQGDKFKKFGGGTKNLGDFFTDKKIPTRLRMEIPLIADGGEILIVCGVEISEQVKITDKTKNIGYVLADDFSKE